MKNMHIFCILAQLFLFQLQGHLAKAKMKKEENYYIS